MNSEEAVMVAIAGLAIGVLVARSLQQFAVWLVQTAGRLLLVAAIVAVLWLLMKPGAASPQTDPPSTVWWE